MMGMPEGERGVRDPPPGPTRCMQLIKGTSPSLCPLETVPCCWPSL